METLKERRIKYIEDKAVQDKKRAEEVLQSYIKEVEKSNIPSKSPFDSISMVHIFFIQ